MKSYLPNHITGFNAFQILLTLCCLFWGVLTVLCPFDCFVLFCCIFLCFSLHCTLVVVVVVCYSPSQIIGRIMLQHQLDNQFTHQSFLFHTIFILVILAAKYFWNVSLMPICYLQHCWLAGNWLESIASLCLFPPPPSPVSHSLQEACMFLTALLIAKELARIYCFQTGNNYLEMSAVDLRRTEPKQGLQWISSKNFWKFSDTSQ